MIVLQHVSKVFAGSDKTKQVHAVDNVNLTIQDGDIFGIIGMFLGVPFTAVLYSLFSFVVEIGLENKRVSPDKMDA